MRYILIVLIGALASCSTLRQEIDYVGGIPEQQAQRLLPAYSREDRADRYLIALTILAQLNAATATDGHQARASVNAINRANRAIRDLTEVARDCPVTQHTERLPVISTACRQSDTPAFAFETLSYEAQSALYEASKTILNNTDLELDLQRLAQLDVFWMMSQIYRARRHVPTLRRSAALYRDVTLTLADAFAAQCNSTRDAGSRWPDECDSLSTLSLARGGLDTSLNPDRGPLHNARAAMRKLIRDRDFSIGLADRHRAGLQYHIDAACTRLHKLQELENQEDFTVAGCAET